jgi:hypothetical protein
VKTVLPLFLVAVASVTILGANSSMAKRAVAEATVCDLVKRSNHFDKRNVRVEAVVMSDLIEHTMLVDNECPARGISLWIPHELDNSMDVRALRSELRGQWTIPPSNTQISAVFDGTFLREHRKLYLKVSSIDHINVAPGGR